MLLGIQLTHLWLILLRLIPGLHCFNHTGYSINGILNVYKPFGMTCADVTNTIKRTIIQSSEDKRRTKIPVGHGGTLDKNAEGVLAVGIGSGTKLLDRFLKGDKVYECTGKLGFETDTNELMGKIIRSASWSHVTDAMMDRVIMSFKGLQMQESPIYSAKKFEGMSLYKYAQRGLEVPPKLSLVDIMDIYRIGTEQLPNFSLFIHCSGGTYVRSLIRDVGRRLNSYATMTSLVRTRKVDLRVEDSIPLAELTYDAIVANLKPVKYSPQNLSGRPNRGNYNVF